MSWIHKTGIIYQLNITNQFQNTLAFDLDGTLIKTKSGNKFPKDQNDWTWRFDNIKDKLKELYLKGNNLVIFTNQMGINGKRGYNKIKEQSILTKIDNIVTEINLPISVFISTSDDKYRKPNTQMWNLFLQSINLEQSQEAIYVGDAAGRVGDFSDSDLKFAQNCGIRFMTEKEFFR